jgi:molybdopterin synthase sulfur carrier subunit
MLFEEYHVRFLLFPFKSLYSFSGEIGLKIHVKFLATIREITDKSEIELELHSGDTVGTALQALQTLYGAEFKEATTGTTAGGIPKVRFLVNGRDTDFLEGFATVLKEGDVMVLVPPIAGG